MVRGNTNHGGKKAARQALCVALFAVLGGLIERFAEEPERVGGFFKLTLIQNKAQKTFTGHTAPGGTKLIAKRTMAPTAELELLNGGLGDLVFYFAETDDAPPPASGITVASGTSQTVTAAQLGNTATAMFLMVHTPGEGEGAWEVDV